MTGAMSDLDLLKLNLQEKSGGTFTDEDLQALLNTHQNVWLASYFGCYIKATTKSDIELPGGLKTKGNSDYWMKLAEVYHAKYEKSIAVEEEKEESDLVLNKLGYKNSMARADEFPKPKMRW